MAWLYLIGGALLEVVWVIGLKYLDGLTDYVALVPTVIALALSFWLFARVLQLMPISIAYAVYTGLGAFGTAVAGMAFLGESVGFLKIMLLLILISCIIGLKAVDQK